MVAVMAVGGAVLATVLLFVTRGDDGGRAANTTVADTTGVSGSPPTDLSSGVTTGETAVSSADLPVLVVNASGTPGTASVVVADLQSAGYGAVPPPSASSLDAAETTSVYFFVDDNTSYEADAEAVAEVIGVQSSSVVPMPADVAAEIVDVEENAAVLVVLGADFAARG